MLASSSAHSLFWSRSSQHFGGPCVEVLFGCWCTRCYLLATHPVTSPLRCSCWWRFDIHLVRPAFNKVGLQRHAALPHLGPMLWHMAWPWWRCHASHQIFWMSLWADFFALAQRELLSACLPSKQAWGSVIKGLIFGDWWLLLRSDSAPFRSV